MAASLTGADVTRHLDVTHGKGRTMRRRGFVVGTQSVIPWETKAPHIYTHALSDIFWQN